MKSNYWTLALIAAISCFTLGCSNDEEPFLCETNTVFQFAGSSEKWCGRSEFRQYSYDEIEDEENASVFVRYPAGNVTLIVYKVGQFAVGEVLTKGNGISLSGDIGSINSASFTFTKVDREAELVSFYFDLDYHAGSNLTHWDVTGTVTDLPLKVE